jgi:hypothetical protein
VRETNADTVLGAFSNTLLTVLVLFLIFGLTFHILKTDRPKEWQICWDLPLTDETKCGEHEFDTLDSCEASKDWFVATINKTWSHTDKAAQGHRCKPVR